MHISNPATVVLTGGFLLALVFGYIANRTRFCTMGAVADIVNMGDWGRMRMWLAAIGAALIGASLLQLAGQVDLEQSIYAAPNMIWLSNIVGGFLFGVGMTMASGCGNRTLVRMGGGSLKSLVVFLVMGVTAYMTLKGLTGAFRVNVLDKVSFDFSLHDISHQDLPSVLAGGVGLPARAARWVLGVALPAALLVFALFRGGRRQIAAGVAIGLLVAGAWYVTGHLGYGEDPDTLQTTWFATNSNAPEAFSFIAPAAYLLEWLMLWTDASLKLTFGIVTVVGVALGSLIAALTHRTFRWEGFAGVDDLANHLIGGILMGFGGVTAMGCTIGQGISGVSTLSFGSLLAFAAIVLGAVANLKFIYWRMSRQA